MNCNEIKIKEIEQPFNLCVEDDGIIIKHKDDTAFVSFEDFRNYLALKAIFGEKFGYDIKDPLTDKIVGTLQVSLKLGDLYKVCLKYENDRCEGNYIMANERGVFIVKRELNEMTDEHDTISTLVSKIRIRKIQNLMFGGIFDTNVYSKVLKIETYDGRTLIGTIDEILKTVRNNYGLKNPDEFRFLLSQRYDTDVGYYAVGPWFLGSTVDFATTSSFNPSWKRIRKYKIPTEIHQEEKRDVLRRIVNTVSKFGDRKLITWILSFSVIANFAHYIRQVMGFFPHMIITGEKETGKSTIVSLIKYLYWGNNTIPYSKPSKYALSQSTLPVVIEEWNETDLLYRSAQTFVLDEKRLVLSLSSIIAEANHEDPMLEDKIIYIKIGKSQGMRKELINPGITLLRRELNLSYDIHDVLNAIGVELIQIASVKLKQFNFNRRLSDVLDGLISLGFISWIDLFKKYTIPYVDYAETENNHFPVPRLSCNMYFPHEKHLCIY
jgi:hypothetical protein